MGKEETVYTWSEVQLHTKKDDKWLVMDGQVYNITNWVSKHPGGSKVISHYAGQDATDAIRAFHNDLDKLKKYLKPLHLGAVQDIQNRSIDEDFRQLRSTAEQMGLFKPSFLFYAAVLTHIMVLEVLAYLTLYYFGTGWLPFIVSILLYATMQVQVCFSSHDFGHLSVFHNRTWDHFFHFFTLGFLKGLSPVWWNQMHYQHHAKPNVLDKDPDVRLDKLFVVGEVMPVEVAKSRKHLSVPFQHQHKYFFIVGPPLLFPVYFFITCLNYIYKRRLWLDAVLMVVYFVKFFYFMVPMVGWGWAIFYYEVFKILESIWFTWVAEANHLPMNIEHDADQPWLKLQLAATCDFEKSFFNDWFTGHLNFQIEHHLFPMMPRHNLYKIQPLARSLCKKHDIPFIIKPLMTSFVDLVKSLKHSGELWNAVYHAHHLS